MTNTDARNDVRFEGHNAFGPTQGGPAGSVRGHIAESRITTIDPRTGQVTPRHLPKHLDYSRDGTPDDPATGLFLPDRARQRALDDSHLRALGQDSDGDGGGDNDADGDGALTFTAVPPGSGRRIGIDRDLDGVLDGDQDDDHHQRFVFADHGQHDSR